MLNKVKTVGSISLLDGGEVRGRRYFIPLTHLNSFDIYESDKLVIRCQSNQLPLDILFAHFPHHLNGVESRAKKIIWNGAHQFILIDQLLLTMVSNQYLRYISLLPISINDIYPYGIDTIILVGKEGEIYLFDFRMNDILHTLSFVNECILGEIGIKYDSDDNSDGEIKKNKRNSLRITSIIQPPTYVNKLVISLNNGHIILGNLKKNKFLFEFDMLKEFGCISSLMMINQIDCILVLQHHVVTILNLRTNKMLFQFKVLENRRIISAFHKFDENQIYLGLSSGKIIVVDCERSIIIFEKQVHNTGSPVLSISPLFDGTGFITNSNDNSIKLWKYYSSDYDLEEGENHLKLFDLNIERCGHCAPLTSLSFHSDDTLVTTSNDGMMKYFHMNRSIFNFNFGHSIQKQFDDETLRLKKKENKKNYLSDIYQRVNEGKSAENENSEKFRNHLYHHQDILSPVITKTKCCLRRYSLWDDCISLHQSSTMLSSWNIFRKCRGSNLFSTDKKCQLKIVDFDISVCGSYVLLANEENDICSFNLQSGRDSFRIKPKLKNEKIQFISFDSTSCRFVVITTNGLILLFDNTMKKKKLIRQFRLERIMIIYSFDICKKFDYISICHSDDEKTMIKIVDIDSMEIIRTFPVSSISSIPFTMKFLPNFNIVKTEGKTISSSPNHLLLFISMNNGDVEIFNVYDNIRLIKQKLDDPITSISLPPSLISGYKETKPHSHESMESGNIDNFSSSTSIYSMIASIHVNCNYINIWKLKIDERMMMKNKEEKNELKLINIIRKNELNQSKNNYFHISNYPFHYFSRLLYWDEMIERNKAHPSQIFRMEKPPFFLYQTTTTTTTTNDNIKEEMMIDSSEINESLSENYLHLFHGNDWIKKLLSCMSNKNDLEKLKKNFNELFHQLCRLPLTQIISIVENLSLPIDCDEKIHSEMFLPIQSFLKLFLLQLWNENDYDVSLIILKLFVKENFDKLLFIKKIDATEGNDKEKLEKLLKEIYWKLSNDVKRLRWKWQKCNSLLTHLRHSSITN
ncbi:hypothetical protein SNEBB_002656 [Seison nebaliae]|nr:hypothetical protein SNEBB_002656 [Seison nebaliae]